MDRGLRATAERWIADDIDPRTQAELRDVVDSACAGSSTAVADLADRMSAMPTFGTAGMRASMRAGPNGMNRAVVVRTTAGVARWLTKHGHDGGVVVVGRDARLSSDEFATDTAAVLSAAGFDVRLLPESLPTPVLVHATRSLKAVAGVQITASHNPAQDNGYKLYLGGGVGLAAPQDREIEASISEVGGARSVRRREAWSAENTALDDYLARVAELPHGAARDLRIAATALHGVGARPLVRALHQAGFDDVHLVESQREPDPGFPTVAVPNPEEPDTTAAVRALAAEIDADVAVALDPDADRCAVGLPDALGHWRMLTGDETGVLLGEHILSTVDRIRHPDPLVATTIVSSSMLGRIAEAHGSRYAETLTGFKWLMRSGDGHGTGLIFAYEEALGHCVDPEHVRDKDGISAAVVLCDLAATAKSSGQSLTDLLDELAVRHGVHETAQVSVRVPRSDALPGLMRRLRAGPPTELAGSAVRVRDLLPDSDVLVWYGDGWRVVIRPSGTEPKLKCYLQIVEPVRRGGLEASRESARARIAELRASVCGLVRL